jgi:hypothetical protein
MTGFGWNSAVVASAGPATFAYPYTGSRNREQIGILEKECRVSESAGRSFEVFAGNLRGDPTILIETWASLPVVGVLPNPVYAREALLPMSIHPNMI